MENILPIIDDDRFKKLIGMTREPFMNLVNVIKDQEVFQGSDQLPAVLQLAIVLTRLRCKGPHELKKLSGSFGIGDGSTVDRVTRRVFKAILSVDNLRIQWPNAEERRALAVDTIDDLPECVGIVDGTHHSLHLKPRSNAQHYYSYKSEYSLKTQIICNKNKKIIHVLTGICGSVHDATIFKKCDVYRNPQKYLSGLEYIAGDSAYPLSPFCLTPYKRNSTHMTAPDRKLYNKTFSKFRVRVENCIGETKNQFPSLKELPQEIRSQNDVDFLSEWVAVCCILHNYIMDYNEYEEYFTSGSSLTNVVSVEDEEWPTEPSNGEEKRQWLFNQLFE